MCGIFAYLGSDGKVIINKKEFVNDFYNLKHRGPDSTTPLKIMPKSIDINERQKKKIEFEKEVSKTLNETFDETKIENLKENFADKNDIIFGFHRLMINGLSELSNQPLELDGVYLICNGEIFNHKQLQNEHKFNVKTQSDCEIILHMYKKFGIMQTVSKLDAEYCFVLYDTENAQIFVARDHIGIRPLFMGEINKNESKHESKHESKYIFSSEMKGCTLCSYVEQFPPATVWSPDFGFKKYWSSVPKKSSIYGPREVKLLTLKRLFKEAVYKRLMSDRPIGMFLSGGLDSSLVCSIVKDYLNNNKITSGKFPQNELHTFSIGTSENSPDIIAGKKVAEYLGTKHHIVYFTLEEGITSIRDVIKCLETYDITTIRASTPMWLLSKYVKEKTDIKVLLSGEGSDEIFGGYLYFHNAPSVNEFQEETQRLIDNLHKYDVLRADRCTSAHGLELRVPFLDKEFVGFVLSMNPYEKWCKTSKSHIKTGYKSTNNPSIKSFNSEDDNKPRIEKSVLREIFNPETDPEIPSENKKKPALPLEILMRSKNAFSDAVGYNWVDSIKDYTNTVITDKQLSMAHKVYPHNSPKTKEAYYYRKLFEEMYPDRVNILTEMWLPKWNGEQNDPSARKLPQFKSE